MIAYPIQGSKHLAVGEKGSYSMQLPTSGNHAPSWGPTGTYAKPLPDEVQVHNLEHGHVVIQYAPGKLPPAILEGLTQLIRQNETFAALAPRPAEGFDESATLAFTAWGVRQLCPAPSSGALGEARLFIREHGKKGPETVPGRPIRETPPVK